MKERYNSYELRLFLWPTATSFTFFISARTLGAVSHREQRALGVEDAISSLAYPSLAGENGHTRLRHQLVDISYRYKATSESFLLPSHIVADGSWPGSYVVNHTHRYSLALVRVRIRVSINFRGWKFSRLPSRPQK